MIKSLLENDLYVFTMWYAMEKLGYGNHPVEYTFVNRGKVDLLPYKDEIEKEVGKFCSLYFGIDDVNYLNRLHFLGNNAMDALFDDVNVRKLKRDNINIYEENGELKIKVKGPWRETIFFEIPVLAIISGVYHKHNAHYKSLTSFLSNTEEKRRLINQYGIKVADFGTRRRASFRHQDELVRIFSKSTRFSMKNINDHFVGTSNVYLAKKYDVRPIGTMAHQWIQAFQGIIYDLSDSQRMALESWMHVYRGNLGIALSDTIGIDAFLNDFDMMLAKLYDGVRQDSGDPLVFGEKMVKHYERLGINPMTKTIVFSDSLDLEKAKEINDKFKDRINVSFGIGTFLTNDCGYKPLSIVMKLTKFDGLPVAKLSDEPGKTICKDVKFLKELKLAFNVKGG